LTRSKTTLYLYSQSVTHIELHLKQQCFHSACS